VRHYIQKASAYLVRRLGIWPDPVSEVAKEGKSKETPTSCYVVLIPGGGFRIDKLKKGTHDRAVETVRVGSDDDRDFIGAYTSKKEAQQQADNFGEGSQLDSRYILQIPCSPEQLPILFKAGIGHAIERVYTVSQMRVNANHPGENNPHFNSTSVKEALATATDQSAESANALTC